MVKRESKEKSDSLGLVRIHAKRQLSFFLFLLMVLNFSSVLFSIGRNIKFENISIEKGLSQSTVNCILQDSRGFVWFGTEDGLNRYDGYHFTIYKSDSLDSRSLSDSYILSIYEDKTGVLWIGTHTGGLNKFDREKEIFTQYKHDPGNPDSLGSNFVNTICEDRNGVLWIGTYGGGLNRFDREKRKFTKYIHDPDNPESVSNSSVNTIYEDRSGVLWIGTVDGLNKIIPGADKGSSPIFIRYKHYSDDSGDLSNIVRSIYEDQAGVLWIGTDGGLYKLIPGAKEDSSPIFIHYRSNPKNPNSLGNNNVRSIIEDRTGVLWIGTYGGGINRFDREKGQFEHLVNEPGNPGSLSNNFVNTIYIDKTDVLWVGTFGGGFDRFDQEKEKFMHYRNKPNNPNSLNNNTVFSIHEDRTGVFWIGTYGGGLARFDRERGIFKHYMHDSSDPNSISNNNVRCIHEDRTGVLWVGTYDGLNKFNRKKEKFVRYKHDPHDSNSLSNNYVRTIYEDRSGRLWIGTIGGGLNRLIPSSYEGSPPVFIRYRHDPDDSQSLSNNRVYSVLEDKSGILWIGTGGGLNRLVPGANEGSPSVFVHYRHDANNLNSLSNDRVFSIYEDRTGALWVGTYGGGLNKFVSSFDQESPLVFIHYKEKDGLPNDVVYGILEDDEGNLWISTNKGLSKFNPQSETFRNYDASDGLQSNEFNSGAYHKSQSGEMFFGGINGFNTFYPDSVRDNPHIPPVVITDFQLFNKSVPIGRETEERSILEKSIIETEAVELHYKDRVFSFDFAALHYASPEKNEYAYMMEGFEKNWNYVGNRHFATYTNLPPGSYVFRVKGSNNDGIWNEEGTSLKIVVKPPFWDTWWFMTLGILAGITLVYGLHRYRIRLLRHRAKTLEQKVKERTSDLILTNKRLQQEITERRETERALSESEEKLRNLFEYASDGIFAMDLNGAYTQVNQKFLEMHGVNSRDEIIGESGFKFVAPSDAKKAKEGMKEILKKGAVISQEFKALKADGTEFPVEVSGSLLKNDSGSPVGIIGITRDITDRKMAENALRESEEKFRSLAEYSPNMVFINMKGRIVYANKRCEEIMGYTRDEFFSPDFGFLCLIAPESVELIKSNFNKHMKVKEVKPIEYSLITKSGKKIEAILATKLVDYEGEKAILGVITDITEWKRAEQRIKDSLKEKEVMLQEIHHRVKNNLQIISSLLKLQSGYIKSKDVVEMFRDSQARIKSMALIHNKLYQSKDMAKVDFADYVRSLSTDLFHSYKASSGLVRLKVNAKEVFLDINSAIPCGLIINELVSNALKHGFPNGKRGEVIVDLNQNKENKFTLVVADNGVGFPEDLDFRNTKSLGMRLVCILTEQLGGTVELVREAGTKFEIRF